MKRVVMGVFLFFVAASLASAEQVGSADLVGRWSFDEASWGTTVEAVKDSAPAPPGSSSHGTAFGGAKTEAGGKKSSAAIFDGVDDYISIPSSAALTPSSEVSVSGWFRINEIPDPTTGRSITGSMVSKRDGYILSPDTDRSISFYVNVGGTWQVAPTPAATLQFGTWHHLVGTYDGSAIRIYVDGVERGSRAAPGSIANNAEPICIGHDYCGADKTIQGRYFGGAMDEIGIYRRALTAAEVQELRQTSTANAPGAACGVGDQAILRLYGESNSHIAAGDKDAPYSICFKRLFPSEPLPAGNAYACTGSNILLRATGNENAHVESSVLNSAGYQPLCYGELTCSLTPANGACGANQVFVVALSAETNAHASAIPAPGYPYHLCCSVKGPTITSVEWRSAAPTQDAEKQKLAGVGSQYDATNPYPFTADGKGKAKIVVNTKNIKLADLQNFKIEVKDVDKDMDAADDQTDDIAGTQLTPIPGSASVDKCESQDGKGCEGSVWFLWTFSDTDAGMKKMYNTVSSAKEDEKTLVGERFELVGKALPNTAGISSRDSDILYAKSGKGWVCNLERTMATNLETGGNPISTLKSAYPESYPNYKERQKLAGDACKGPDSETGGLKNGISTSRDDCCPASTQCTDTGCVLKGITSCQDYTNDDDCSKDRINVWRNKPGYVSTSVCGDTTYDQRCKWTPKSIADGRNPPTPIPAGQSGICEYGLRQISKSALPSAWGTEKAACLYNYVPQDKCGEDNFQTVTITATETGDFDELSCQDPKKNCHGGVEHIPCGQPAVELPFFGAAQFLGAVVSIALLYVVMFQFQKVRRFLLRRK